MKKMILIALLLTQSQASARFTAEEQLESFKQQYQSEAASDRLKQHRCDLQENLTKDVCASVQLTYTAAISLEECLNNRDICKHEAGYNFIITIDPSTNQQVPVSLRYIERINPEAGNNGALTIVVGENYQELVSQNSIVNSSMRHLLSKVRNGAVLPQVAQETQQETEQVAQNQAPLESRSIAQVSQEVAPEEGQAPEEFGANRLQVTNNLATGSNAIALQEAAQKKIREEAIRKYITQDLLAQKDREVIGALHGLFMNYSQNMDTDGEKFKYGGTSTFKTCQKLVSTNYSYKNTKDQSYEWDQFVELDDNKIIEKMKHINSQTTLQSFQELLKKSENSLNFSDYLSGNFSIKVPSISVAPVVTFNELIPILEGIEMGFSDPISKTPIMFINDNAPSFAFAVLAFEKSIHERNGNVTIENLAKRASDEGLSTVGRCTVFATTTKENFKGESKLVGTDDEDLYTNPKPYRSFDKRISCSSSGIETIDYDECRRIVFTYNAAQVAIKGNETIQQFQAQNHGHDANMKLMGAGSDPNADITTLALEVQRDGIKKQQDMAETRRALQVAKLGTLGTLAMQLPQQEDLRRKCKGGDDPDKRYNINDILSGRDMVIYAGAAIPHLSRINDKYSICDDVLVDTSITNAFLRNSSQIDNVKAILAEAGIDALKEHMAADTLGKQQDMINNVINKVKGADVLDLPEFAGMTEDQIQTYCETYPNAAECSGITGKSTTIMGPGLSITGGVGENTIYTNPTDDTIGDGGNAISTGNDDSTAPAKGTGNRTIASVNKGGSKGPNAPAAKVTSQVRGASGNGGGGGVGGGGGLSGGGGSGAGAPAGYSPSKRRGSGLSYSGGGRSLSFTNGRRNSRKSGSSNKVGNPFAKMFDKNKKTNGQETLNFRGLASEGIGSKKGNLFKRISSRYDAVNEKDRLIKYELAK